MNKSDRATLPLHQWKYSTRPPVITRIEQHSMHLPAGHRYGYRRKACLFHPREVLYKVYCMCKWSTTRWWSSLPRAFRAADIEHYEKHIQAQPSLFEEVKRRGKLIDGSQYL